MLADPNVSVDPQHHVHFPPAVGRVDGPHLPSRAHHATAATASAAHGEKDAVAQLAVF